MRAVQVGLLLLCAFLAISQGEQVSNACQTCLAKAEDLSTKLSTHQRDFILIKDRVCGEIPAAGRTACEQLLDATHPVIRSALVQPTQVDLA